MNSLLYYSTRSCGRRGEWEMILIPRIVCVCPVSAYLPLSITTGLLLGPFRNIKHSLR